MQQYQYILFDLDGTLTDPALGITNSVIHALSRFGISVTDRKELYPFIGPPLTDSFRRFYGCSEEQAAQAVEYYREYFKDKGIFENTLIDGAEPLLKSLKQHGKTVILATSKPLVFADRILKHFSLDRYFDFTCGSELDGRLTDKAEVIGEALRQAGITDLARAVMIGDRSYDMIGATKNGLTPVGVLFGYGSREELTDAGAVFLAESMDSLNRYLLQ